MKVCIIQPKYSSDWNDSEALFLWQLKEMDKCDSTMDLIVLPEATDVPSLAKTIEQHRESHRRYTDAILKKASENIKAYQVVYTPLSGDAANYVGVANTYRQYLIAEKGLKNRIVFRRYYGH